jgi:hypothetical protein
LPTVAITVVFATTASAKGAVSAVLATRTFR